MKFFVILILIYILIQYVISIRNYVTNIKFDCCDFIENQRDASVARYRFGLKDSGYNGCGWISCYNILKMLGIKVAPAQIICALEVLLTPLCLGFFGTNPLSIVLYLALRGYKVRLRFNSDKCKSDLGIILYLTKKCHAHYVAYQKCENAVFIHNPNVKCDSFTEYIDGVSGKFILMIEISSQKSN